MSRKYKIIIFCLVLLFVSTGAVLWASCETNKINNNKKQKVMISDSKEKLYSISFNVFSPYALYINDFLADFGNRNVSTAKGVIVNPYVLRSGTYKFKMILYPLMGSKDGLLHPSDLEDANIVLGCATPDDYNAIKSYDIPKLTKPVPYLVIEDTFTADLPYDLEGWGHSRIFAPKTAEDSAALTKQVVAWYETFRQELNNGEFDKFYSRYKHSEEEESVFNYRTLEDIHAEDAKFINEHLKKEAVNNMVPIEDYQLYIFAQGRVLSLLRKPTTEAYGQKINLNHGGVLLWNSENELSNIGVKLHMPMSSNQFEIIRP
jgi:hypothetical protein